MDKTLEIWQRKKLFAPSPRHRKTKLNQAQLQQIEGWIEENSDITVKEMRIRIQEKFRLNISKSTVHCHMKKMKFSYITPRPVRNVQDKSKQEELKKIPMKLSESILKRSCFALMNKGFAHIRKLGMDGLKKALELG